MKEFVYLYRGAQLPATPEEAQREMQRWVTWLKELAEKGHVKSPGHPLERTGKLVSGKSKAITDGPFAEKDVVGGYSLIDARDLAQAAELAKGCPIFDNGGYVEVRPVIAM